MELVEALPPKKISPPPLQTLGSFTLPSLSLPTPKHLLLPVLPPRTKFKFFPSLSLKLPHFVPGIKKRIEASPFLGRGGKGESPFPHPSLKLPSPRFLPPGEALSYREKKKVLEPKPPGERRIKGPVGGRKILRDGEPLYPEWAERQGIEGKVIIKFWVDPKGRVIQALIKESSGWEKLDELARRKILDWRFDPIRERVDQWGEIPFIFRLERK